MGWLDWAAPFNPFYTAYNQGQNTFSRVVTQPSVVRGVQYATPARNNLMTFHTEAPYTPAANAISGAIRSGVASTFGALTSAQSFLSSGLQSRPSIETYRQIRPASALGSNFENISTQLRSPNGINKTTYMPRMALPTRLTFPMQGGRRYIPNSSPNATAMQNLPTNLGNITQRRRQNKRRSGRTTTPPKKSCEKYIRR